MRFHSWYGRVTGSGLRRTQIAGLIILLSFALQLPLRAQQANPTVAFTLDFPGSEPEHYIVSVDSVGHAVYESNGKLTDQSDGDPFRLEFQISEPNRAKIFDLAARANYFEGQVDSGRTNLAMMGAKTLSYQDGKKNTKAAYNYSLNPAIQELTALFQNLSTTLEFGRRLKFYQKYQKLALDDELKTMQRMTENKLLAELPAVAQILKGIMQDTTIMRTARARASWILQQASTPPAAH